MSQASAQAFLDQIGKDSSLRAALLALNPGSAGSVSASVRELVLLAGQWGFDFDQRDIAEACAARARLGEHELDDAALEGVAGGASRDPISAARFSITVDGYQIVRFSFGASISAE